MEGERLDDRRPDRYRGEAEIGQRLFERAARRVRFAALVARDRRLSGPPVAVGRRVSVLFGSHGEFVRGGRLTLGDDFAALVDGRLTIGNDVFFNRGANLAVYSAVTIGDSCLFGERVSIHDEDHVPGGQPEGGGADAYRVAPVTIGTGVWIGANVVILRGSRIGDHAVVAAGSVVRGDIPANSLAGGLPARVLRDEA